MLLKPDRNGYNMSTPEKKVLRFQAPDGAKYVAHFYRNPPLPEPYTASWAVATSITKDGGIETSAWITVSGRHEETPDEEGHYRVKPPTTMPYMWGVWSDVDGPSFVFRGNNLPKSCLWIGINDATNAECCRMENDGTLKAKSVQTQDGANGVLQWGPHTMTVQGGRIMSVERAPWGERAKWIFGRWLASGE